MNRLQKIGRAFVVYGLALLATSSATAQVERYVAGTHYQKVPLSAELQHLQTPGDKPQVTEVFWYGCPHCYAFDPLLDAWVAEQAGAIDFQRLPMVWDALTQQHARMTFAAQALGVSAQLHRPFFDEIQQHHNPLAEDSAIATFFGKHGIAADQFNAAFKSFAMDTTVRNHEAAVMVLHVPSVPAMLVNGRYLVQVDASVPTHAVMLEVVEFLLHKQD
jgi:protein dithiol oxidoreductase (disulfide-forming)